MPKADATGLAPKKSAVNPLSAATCWQRGLLFQVRLCLDFFGGALELRPWAYQGEDAGPPLRGFLKDLSATDAEPDFAPIVEWRFRRPFSAAESPRFQVCFRPSETADPSTHRSSAVALPHSAIRTAAAVACPSA